MRLKKITAIMLVSALLLGAAGCGGENADNESVTTTSAQENGAESDAGTSDASQEENENNAGGAKTPEDIGIINDTETAPTVGSNDDFSYAENAEDSEYALGGALTDRMAVLSELNTGNQVRLAGAMKKAAAG